MELPVVRDNLGRVLKVQALRENIVIPKAAEAAAILRAILLAVEDGHVNLYCESDAKGVIQSLNQPVSSHGHWSTAGFIKKTRVMSKFPLYLFCLGSKKCKYLGTSCFKMGPV